MQQKVTMKDIASKLGLSINSISIALNDRVGVSDETRRLVLRTAEEMGFLDQSKKYSKVYVSRNICVLIKRTYFRDMHFYSKILLGLEEEARKNNYDILMTILDNNEIPNCIRNRKVAGILIVGKVEAEFLICVKQYEIPIILVDTIISDESIDSVITDNRLGACKAVRLLIESGFSKIGFFGDLDYSESIRERFWGYKEAIKELNGINSYNDTFIYAEQFSVLSDIEHNVLNNDFRKVKERVKSVYMMPEVFLCSNDFVAIQVSNSLKSLGYRIPEDVGVMGFDDLDLCRMFIPNLTTIRVNKELMGKRAIQLFLWRLSNRTAPVEKIVVGIEVIIRDSVSRR